MADCGGRLRVGVNLVVRRCGEVVEDLVTHVHTQPGLDWLEASISTASSAAAAGDTLAGASEKSPIVVPETTCGWVLS